MNGALQPKGSQSITSQYIKVMFFTKQETGVRNQPNPIIHP